MGRAAASGWAVLLLLAAALLLPEARAQGFPEAAQGGGRSGWVPSPWADNFGAPTAQRPAASASARVSQSSEPDVVLELADCQPAEGGPHGLSCAKEGYFISGFEKEGQWLVGGGLVPLAHATCCRILPPKQFSDPSGQEFSPESVVSTGCHLASGQRTADLRCGAEGASFATGFENDARVNPTMEAFYPLGPLSCCTPAILLTNGDLWSTKRCQCEDTPHTHCSATDAAHHLLVGFQTYREARSRQHVPITPMQCCKTCLGDRIVDNTCAALNSCSRHGQCVFGACECHAGWEGQDCSAPQSGGGGGSVTSWQIAVLVVGAAGIAVSVLVLAGHVVKACISDQAEDEGEEMSTALLLRLDADDAGSVGSEDTTDNEEDGEEERAEDEEDGALEQPEGGDVETPAVDVDARETEAHDSIRTEGAEAREMVPFDVEEPAAVGQAASEHGHCYSEEECEGEDDGYGDCNICFSRPIQVVVVPCGHACMCRRCSRRVARCPICRIDVARRQRLFMGK